MAGRDLGSEAPCGLDGLRVLVWAEHAPAIFAAGLMADHGADVVFFEEGDGSPVRRLESAGRGAAGRHFDAEARGARSMQAPPEPEAVREVLTALDFDVLIEDLGVGELERRLGGGAAAIQAIPASLVRVSPFGATGPRARWRGGDRVAQAFAGAAACTGRAGGPPRPHKFPIANYWCGWTIANASVLSWLTARRGTRSITDLALYEPLLRWQEEMIAEYDQLGVVRTRFGNEYPESAPSNAYCSADNRWVFIGTADNASFARLCAAMEAPELAQDPRYSDVPSRVVNRTALNEAIAAWMGANTAATIEKALAGAGTPAIAIRSLPELLTDEHMVTREAFARIPLGESGERVVPGVFPRLSEAPGNLRGPAPSPGEHTDEVIAGWRPRERGHGLAWDEEFLPSHDVRAESKSRPLDGLRVLDLGRFVAGPMPCEWLAEFGAEVTRVELPGGYASARPRMPRKDGVSLSNAMYQRGKRAITLDIRKPRGRDLLLELLKDHDVLIENFRPGTLEKWGLGIEQMRAANPGIVVTRVSGFGQGGPRSNDPSFDPIAIAAGGGTAVLGGEGDSVPLRPGPLLADCSAGLGAVFGTLVGLAFRGRTGRGETVDVALNEGVSRMLGGAVAAVLEGDALAADDWRWPTESPYRVMPAADDRFVLIEGEDVEGHQALAELLRSQPAAEAARILQAKGIAACPVMDAEALVQDAHLRARDNLIVREHHLLGPLLQQGVVPRMSPLCGRVVRSEAPYNEYTAQLLGELGLDEQAIEALRSEGVIE